MQSVGGGITTGGTVRESTLWSIPVGSTGGTVRVRQGGRGNGGGVGVGDVGGVIAEDVDVQAGKEGLESIRGSVVGGLKKSPTGKENFVSFPLTGFLVCS